MTLVALTTHSRRLESCNDTITILVVAVGNGKHLDLQRRQPCGELAAKVLDDNTDETLHGAEHHAVDHHRAMLLTVGAGVLQTEAAGKLIVKLNGSALPGSSKAVLNVEVQLGTVEGAVALVNVIGLSDAGNGIRKSGGGNVPILHRTDVILGHGGKLDLIGQTEQRVNLVKQLGDADDLVLDLLGGKKDMGIVLCEATNTEQTVKRARKLMAVYAAQLAVTQRQLTVGVRLKLIYQNTAGAVHGLDGEILLVNEGGVHVFFIVIPVTRSLPQCATHDLGGGDLLVVPLVMDFVPVIDQRIAKDHTVGKEEGHAGCLVAEGKQTQFFSQLAVVALLCLFHAGEVLLKLGLISKCGTVNTGEHLILLTSAPVSTCHRGQLERLDRRGVGDVRACAKVNEIALLEEGKLLVLGKVVDQLHLIGLALLFHQRDRLGAGESEALHLKVLLGDLLHLSFQCRQLLLGEGVVAVKVVVEAVLDGRANGKLGVGIQTLYRLCEDMRRGMSQRRRADLFLKRMLFHRAVMHNDLHIFQPPVIISIQKQKTPSTFRLKGACARFHLGFSLIAFARPLRRFTELLIAVNSGVVFAARRPTEAHSHGFHSLSGSLRLLFPSQFLSILLLYHIFAHLSSPPVIFLYR